MKSWIFSIITPVFNVMHYPFQNDFNKLIIIIIIIIIISFENSCAA